MTQLKVNTEEYIKCLIEECTKFDSNDEPDLGFMLDPEAKEEKSRQWLDDRIEQLNGLEEKAIHNLKKANNSGFLSSQALFDAQQQYHEAYEDVRSQSRKRYCEISLEIQTLSAMQTLV